jgi:disulfide bond formation protein DsbB
MWDALNRWVSEICCGGSEGLAWFLQPLTQLGAVIGLVADERCVAVAMSRSAGAVVGRDAAALRILGLSLAGWNAMVSAGLAAGAILGIRSRS